MSNANTTTKIGCQNEHKNINNKIQAIKKQIPENIPFTSFKNLADHIP